DVDHRSAAAPLQVRNAVLATEEDALRVDRLDPVPGLDRRLEHGGVVVRGDSGVVVEDVDAAVPLGRRRHHRLDARLVGDVDPVGEYVARLGGGLLRGFEVDVGGADARSLGAEEDRGLTAHPAAGAGDHAHLPV